MFLDAILHQKVQKILHIVLLVQRLHKKGVRLRIRGQGRKAGFPAPQQMGVVCQSAETPLLGFPEFLRLGLLTDIGFLRGRLAVIEQSKILGQFFRSLFGGEVIQSGGKVDHITVRPAAETVKAAV